jgi:hypothetical protein
MVKSQSGLNTNKYRGYTLTNGPGWRVQIFPGPHLLRTEPISGKTRRRADIFLLKSTHRGVA